jgi:broad specificity phosphatase PhoE
MKYLELRRHSKRVIPGEHLSQEGVRLARRVGQSMGPFALVITSTITRAFETALAMGFAVQEQHEAFCPPSDKVNDAIQYPAPFAHWAQQMKDNKHVNRYVNAQSESLHEVVADIDEGDSALIVSHGGVVEAGAVGCAPQFDWAAAGDAVSYCEGVRLSFDGLRFVKVELLRVNG